MLKVILCEDNKKQRDDLTQIVENTIIRENFDMQIVVSTDNPEEVLDYMLNNPNTVAIYFLDVYLNASINGIKLAEKIRDFDPVGFIIFVTTHSEMSFLTFEYKVEAMDYIIKDQYQSIKERINQCLTKAYSRYLAKNKMDDSIFTIQTDETVIHIKYSDILFFETSEQVHKVRIHEEKRQIEFYGTLKDIEKNLDHRFYRCHRSFIVNKEKIKEIDKKNRVIYMMNGEECFASIRHLKGLLSDISKSQCLQI